MSTTQETDSSDDDIQFQIGTFPLELREQLISEFEEPEEILPLTLTSRSLHEATQRRYLTELCDRPITLREIQKHLKTKFSHESHSDRGFSSSFGIFGAHSILTTERIIKIPQWQTLYYTLGNREFDDSPRYTEYMINLETERNYSEPEEFEGIWINPDVAETLLLYGTIYQPYLSMSEKPMENFQVDDILRFLDEQFSIPYESPWTDPKIYFPPDPPILDLLSQYRILSERLGCVRRKSDYAKDRILRELDDFYSEYHEQNNIMTLIGTWAYFHLQSRVFNIYQTIPIHNISHWLFKENGHPVYHLDTQISEQDMMKKEISQMISEIETMYSKVRQAILKLD